MGNCKHHNAGSLTWENSLGYANKNPLLKNKDEITYARKYLESIGFSDIEQQTDHEIQALTVQLIAGNIREMEMFETWEEYQQASEQGRVSGNIFKSENKYFYYLGM